MLLLAVPLLPAAFFLFCSVLAASLGLLIFVDNEAFLYLESNVSIRAINPSLERTCLALGLFVIVLLVLLARVIVAFRRTRVFRCTTFVLIAEVLVLFVIQRGLTYNKVAGAHFV